MDPSRVIASASCSSRTVQRAADYQLGQAIAERCRAQQVASQQAGQELSHGKIWLDRSADVLDHDALAPQRESRSRALFGNSRDQRADRTQVFGICS